MDGAPKLCKQDDYFICKENKSWLYSPHKNFIKIFIYIIICNREQIMTPLQFTGLLGEVDVEATVTDGGETGQSGAIRLALSKALTTFVDMDMREKMRYGKWMP